MKLVIDIGNTKTKYALFEGDNLVLVKSVEDNILINDLTNVSGIGQITSAIISSVKDENLQVEEFLKQRNIKTIVLTHKTPLPFINKYATPETLGKDRIALAAAAQKLYPGNNVLIIDAGTSITYDFVTKKNEYLGGGIAPGLYMRFKSLHTFTAKLPLINPDEEKWPDLVGNTTEKAILSGVMNGILQETDGIINAYKEVFGDVVTVLSGGDYKYFDKRLKNSIFARPNLVLEGWLEILNFNEED